MSCWRGDLQRLRLFGHTNGTWLVLPLFESSQRACGEVVEFVGIRVRAEGFQEPAARPFPRRQLQSPRSPQCYPSPFRDSLSYRHLLPGSRGVGGTAFPAPEAQARIGGSTTNKITPQDKNGSSLIILYRYFTLAYAAIQRSTRMLQCPMKKGRNSVEHFHQCTPISTSVHIGTYWTPRLVRHRKRCGSAIRTGGELRPAALRLCPCRRYRYYLLLPHRFWCTKTAA